MSNDAEKKIVNDGEKHLDKELSNILGPWLEKNNISEAFVFARQEKSDDLIIFYRGHFFDVTSLLATVYRRFRAQIAKELGEQ
ncbi:MAG: hypothetical protein QXU32_00700 [Nitrososphaerales archaeon]